MELHSITDTYTLNNGVKIPVIGFGTWQTSSQGISFSRIERWLPSY